LPVLRLPLYLTTLDETMKLPEENPSIGIIICKTKNSTRVEYTLKTTNKPNEIAKIVRGFDDEDSEVGII